jgi:hypothetical protein
MLGGSLGAASRYSVIEALFAPFEKNSLHQVGFYLTYKIYYWKQGYQSTLLFYFRNNHFKSKP